MCLFSSKYYVSSLWEMLNKNGGFGILLQVLNAVGDLLRNYLGLCTPFTRKRRNCPSSPPPAPSSGQAEARSCSAYKGLAGTGVVPTSTKCKCGARAGWDLHNPEFKEKESYPIQESSKGEKISELRNWWEPEPPRMRRHQGGREILRRGWPVGSGKGYYGKDPAPLPRAVHQTEDGQHAEVKAATEACTLSQDGVHRLPAPSPLSCFIWSGKGKEPQMATAVLLANSDGS